MTCNVFWEEAAEYIVRLQSLFKVEGIMLGKSAKENSVISVAINVVDDRNA